MMTHTIGTIHGDVVRLDRPLTLPPGCRVELTIRTIEAANRGRPKVGQTTGPAFHVPAEALKPLTDLELREWGL